MSVISDISSTQEFFKANFLLLTLPPQETREDRHPWSPWKSRKGRSGISSERLVKKLREDNHYDSSWSRIAERRNKGQNFQNSWSRKAKRKSKAKSNWDRISKREDGRPGPLYRLSKKSLTSFGWTGHREARASAVNLLRPGGEDTEQGQERRDIIREDGESWSPSNIMVEKPWKFWRRLVKKGKKDKIYAPSWRKMAKKELIKKLNGDIIGGSGWIVHKRDGGRVTSGSWSPLGGRGNRPHIKVRGNTARTQAWQEQEQEQEQKQEHQNRNDWNNEERVFIPHHLFLM